MGASDLQAQRPASSTAGPHDHVSALKFITCGSVDDGKSTLIGRLLVDSKSVLQDQLAGVQRSGETDLALLTDGLSAEREQGITIDVAYRYFATPGRKFIIGDAPGHEQYTRNMVTAASSADAAVVLVDATKLRWQDPELELLPQTRRHSLLVNLLRVPSIVFAVNKLDAVDNPTLAFDNIRAALGVRLGCGHHGARDRADLGAEGPQRGAAAPRLVRLPGLVAAGIAGATRCRRCRTAEPLSLPGAMGREILRFCRHQPGPPRVLGPRGHRHGRGRTGRAGLAGRPDRHRGPGARPCAPARDVAAGHSAGIVLDREIDVSRGDWLLAAGVLEPSRQLSATVAWMDDEPLVAGRTYWALHGHRWVKARVQRIVHKLDIHTLAEAEANQLEPNSIGHVEFTLQEPLATLPYLRSRVLGSLVLVDTASHKTSGAVLVR